MKLVIIGGGGVRAPFLAKFVARQVTEMGISSVVLFDTDAERLRIFGGLAKTVAKQVNPALDFQLCTDAVQALRGADYVITTIRPGYEKGRTTDERIALKYGVIGQETTGPGGFGMALRSIPAIYEYCVIVKEHANPGCLVFNFTNPSGLVTQYMRDAGFDNVYGVCDGPGGLMGQLERGFGLPKEEVESEWFGLNHLSWVRSIKYQGQEQIPALIANDKLYSDTECKLFDRDLVERLEMLPNEYLYFYYHRERAIAGIEKSGITRGETIMDINLNMIEALKNMDCDADFAGAMRVYLGWLNKRRSTYFAIESQGNRQKDNRKLPDDLQSFMEGESGAGYVGIVMSFIKALRNGKDKEILLNIPNNGTIDGFAADDVVEVTCVVNAAGVTPKKIGAVPPLQYALMKQVKLYERLTVAAIREQSVSKAVDALWAHPLVGSYSIAKAIVGEYLEAYKEYAGSDWR